MEIIVLSKHLFKVFYKLYKSKKHALAASLLATFFRREIIYKKKTWKSVILCAFLKWLMRAFSQHIKARYSFNTALFQSIISHAGLVWRQALGGGLLLVGVAVDRRAVEVLITSPRFCRVQYGAVQRGIVQLFSANNI
jgi:hypothetical protein